MDDRIRIPMRKFFKGYYKAPAEIVFKAWTDPKLLCRWWGPRFFTNPVCDLDSRPGGAIRIDMKDPDGIVYPMTGTFHDILKPRRLVFSTAAVPDSNGVPRLQTLVTAVFARKKQGTSIDLKVVVVRAGSGTDQALKGMQEGWSQSLERLGELTDKAGITDISAPPGKKEIVLTRILNFPVRLVWNTIVNPADVPRWWGPAGLTTIVDKMAVSRRGEWRYVQRDSSGKQFAFRGIYLRIDPGKKIVRTSNFEAMDGHEMVETMTLTPWGGGTLLTEKSKFRTEEDRDAMLDSGMEAGASESMDRLADLLKTYQAKQAA